VDACGVRLPLTRFMAGALCSRCPPFFLSLASPPAFFSFRTFGLCGRILFFRHEENMSLAFSFLSSALVSFSLGTFPPVIHNGVGRCFGGFFSRYSFPAFQADALRDFSFSFIPRSFVVPDSFFFFLMSAFFLRPAPRPYGFSSVFSSFCILRFYDFPYGFSFPP